MSQNRPPARAWADMPLPWRDWVWRHYYRIIALVKCPECYGPMEIDQITPTGQVFALCRTCERQDLFDTIPLDSRRAPLDRR